MKKLKIPVSQIAVFLTFILILSACVTTPLQENSQSGIVPTIMNPGSLAPTMSDISNPTPKLELTGTSPAASEDSPTATPTVDRGLPSAKPPVVSVEDTISPENASRVAELAGWGTGYSFNVGTGQLAAQGKLLVQKEIIDSLPTFSGGTVRTRFWDIPSGDLSLELIHRDGYDGLFVSPDGTHFAIFQNYCHRENPKPCLLEIRSFPENGLLYISTDPGFINTAIFSPDNRVLALSTDKDIAIWDLETGKLVRYLPDSFGFDLLAYSHDGKLLVGSQFLGDGTVGVWDAATGKLLQSLLSKKFSLGYSPNVIALSPTDTYLALAYGGSIELWKVSDWSEGSAWTWNTTSEITQLAFSPDGRLIASGYADGRITLADAATGKVLKSWDNHSDDTYDFVLSLSFTADGKMLISVSMDQTVRIWGIPA